MAKSRGVKGEKSKGMGKYPSGPINQHKALATGCEMRKVNRKDLGGAVNLKGGMGKGGRISSSGTTGSGYKRTPPRTSGKTPA